MNGASNNPNPLTAPPVEAYPDVTAIILAAGDSTRMGSPKALLQLGGTTFLRRIIDAHLAMGLRVVVVLGSQFDEISRKENLSDVTLLVNRQPEMGQLSSLHVGLGAVGKAAAVIVHPVDHPTVRGETLRSLLSAFRTMPTHIHVPSYAGQTGHPTLFPARFFAALLGAPLHQGARFVVDSHRGSVRYVDVDDPGVLQNVDTPEEYRRLTEDPQFH